MTREEVIFDDAGYLQTRGPLTYRIPRANHIPVNFNVHLLKDSPNPRAATYSSKVIQVKKPLGYHTVPY